MHFTSFSGLGQTCGRECWSQSVYRLVARFDPRFPLLFRVWFCFARSIIIVPFLFFVLRNIDLGVASSSNRRYSPRYQSSELRAFSRLRALGCDKTVSQCVSSLHGRLDFGWGVLRFGSRNGWSVLDGRVVFSLRSRLIVDAATRLLSLRLMLLCGTRPLW